MAARFVEVTLEEMERALKRRFRAYRPRKSTAAGKSGDYMNVFDLKIDDHVAIRVWSSIPVARGKGRGVGEDSIKVQMVSLQKKFSLQSKKNRAIIVQRSRNWADNLEKRITQLQLLYNESADFWSNLAMQRDGIKPPDPRDEPMPEPTPGPPEDVVSEKPRYAGPPVSEAQMKYLVSLIITARDAGLWDSYAKDYGLPEGYITKGALKEVLSGGRDGSASKLISALIKATKGLGRRYATTEEALGLNDPIEMVAEESQHDLYGDPPA